MNNRGRKQGRRQGAAKRPGKKAGKRPELRPVSRSGGTGPGWIYGRHAVLAALANPERRLRRLVAAGSAVDELARHLEKHGRSGAPAPEAVSATELSALLGTGAVHQGQAVLADALPEPGLDEVCALKGSAVREGEARPLAVVLDQVTDPRNVGAILRSAAAFRARAVITTRRNAPPAAGALAKAASGALEIVPYIRVPNLARALQALAELGYWRVGLAARATENIGGPLAAHGRGATALVLGAEGVGLRRLTAEHCDALVRLPTGAAMPELNVSNAAAVALYELARAAAP